MNILYFAIILLPLHSSTHSIWVSHSNNTMPQNDTMLAVGSYNGRIYLLGGFFNKRQQTIYDTETNSFVYRSEFAPKGTKVFGEAQFWTQIGSKLYILDDLEPLNNKISLYNMEDNSFISDFDSLPIPTSDGFGRSCIASSTNKIFINGGITNRGIAMKDTYLLNIDYNVGRWSIAAQMLTARSSHSCIIHPNNSVLYSIGGSSIGFLTSSVEKVSIENIHDNTWTYLSGSLSNGMKGLRSFIYDNKIIIIGGIDQSMNMYTTIQFIDIITDLVSISNITLAFPTVYSAVIMVNNIMYSFGDEFGVDTWQSFTTSYIPTIAPTVTTTTAVTTAVTTTVPIPQVTNATNDINHITIWVKEEDASGLTMAHKIGIGLAVVLLICLVVAVVFFCIRNKATKQRKMGEFKKCDDNGNSDLDMNASGEPHLEGEYDDEGNEGESVTALITVNDGIKNEHVTHC